MRPRVLLILLAAALGCGSEATTPAVTDTFGGSPTALLVDVNMPGLVYSPNNIDIAQGGVLRFVFTELVHDVRFNGALNAPEDILGTSNMVVTRTFPVKGTFAFLCTFHSNMTAKVVVH
jgi:plastocyanin